MGQALRERYAIHSGLGLVLCYFWGNGFVTALSSFSTARLAGEWYFARPQLKRKVAEPRRALQVVKLGLLKHGGSLALAALLLAVLRTLNIVFCWAGRDHRRHPEDSRCRRVWLGARERVAGCLEAFARFVSKGALVEVALSGCGFFEGASRAARRTAAAPKRFAAVESAGALQRATSEAMLVGLAGCAAAVLWASSGWDGEDAAELEDEGGWAAQGGRGALVAAVLPACFGAWLVAESMMHPVSTATSTLLHCWLLEDCSTDASHVPPPFKQLLSSQVEEEGAFAQHYA